MASSDWHLSKNITIGNMMTGVVAILAMFGSYYTLDKRLALLEESDKDQDEAMLVLKEDLMEELGEIKGLIMDVHFNKISEN